MKILRARDRWRKGDVLWEVPDRFDDNPIPVPERCVVINDTGEHDYEGVPSTYVFHEGYGHNIYMNPADLYTTLEECQAEIQRRREAHASERGERELGRFRDKTRFSKKGLPS